MNTGTISYPKIIQTVVGLWWPFRTLVCMIFPTWCERAEAYVLTRFFGNFFSEKKLHEHVLALSGKTRASAYASMCMTARGHARKQVLLTLKHYYIFLVLLAWPKSTPKVKKIYCEPSHGPLPDTAIFSGHRTFAATQQFEPFPRTFSLLADVYVY